MQEPVYDRFLKRFTEFANAIKLGDGLEPGVTMGPLANARRLDAMEAIVNDCKSRGGKIVTGGKRRGNQGYFFEPTVVTDLPDDSKLMTRGAVRPDRAGGAPSRPSTRWSSAPIRCHYRARGLRLHVARRRPRTRSATRWSPAWSASTASPISTPETPFGGVKESGYGHEGGIEGLEAYTVRKFISQA